MHWYPELNRCDTLESVDSVCKQCQKCPLRENAKQVVFGIGNPDADLMFVGEGPGQDEDRRGIPFVGRAGQLLDKILLAAHISKKEVYITNIVMCRPPDNRTPKYEEIDACTPYLTRQIEIIMPRIIVCLGATASTKLIRVATSVTKVHGQIFEKGGIKIIPTFHPAALLRDPKKKKPAWKDFKIIKGLYDELRDRSAVAS